MKIFLIAMTLMASVSSYASYCSVDLVDYYGRTIDSFSSVTDYSGQCRAALRTCNEEKRTRGLVNAQCRQRVSSGPVGPGYPGGGHGNPGGGYGYPTRNFTQYLSYSDYQLGDLALDGRLGSCVVSRGSYNQACDYYLRVNNLGYPDVRGTGCMDSRYTAQYGCNNYSELENAGCMVRKAIMQNSCK